MERMKFEGVGNIIRFNWHFYVAASSAITILFIGANFLGDDFAFIVRLFASLVLTSMLVSLFVSAYIYDFSNLYTFNWLNKNGIIPGKELVNIHAGFDETSHLLTRAYPHSRLTVFDFYDAKKHTEISIERARKAYPAFPNTRKISTEFIPLDQKSVDVILLTLSAHEIRNDDERTLFLKKLCSTLNADGKIVITEHLRDFNNFAAFNIGFLHFLSKRSWMKNFQEAGLTICSESKLTPFLSVFILQANGAAS